LSQSYLEVADVLTFMAQNGALIIHNRRNPT